MKFQTKRAMQEKIDEQEGLLRAYSQVRRDDSVIIEGLAEVVQNWGSISLESFCEVFTENDFHERLDDLGIERPPSRLFP